MINLIFLIMPYRWYKSKEESWLGDIFVSRSVLLSLVVKTRNLASRVRFPGHPAISTWTSTGVVSCLPSYPTAWRWDIHVCSASNNKKTFSLEQWGLNAQIQAFAWTNTNGWSTKPLWKNDVLNLTTTNSDDYKSISPRIVLVHSRLKKKVKVKVD